MVWERGYRSHGLWTDDGTRRLGVVCIGPPGVWRRGVHPYTWSVDEKNIRGEAKTLQAAKAEVLRNI